MLSLHMGVFGAAHQCQYEIAIIFSISIFQGFLNIVDTEDLSFYDTKLWPQHLNVAAEIETRQTRKHLSKLLVSNFWWAGDNSDSCS